MRELRQRVVIIVHPFFPGGGGESVCAWTLQALQGSYKLLLVTYDAVSIQHLNQYYGTYLDENKLSIIRLSSLPLPGWRTGHLSLLKHHLLMRYCKKKKNKEAVFVSTYGEMDFGRPGVQYIHFPLLSQPDLEEVTLYERVKWLHRPSLLRQVYVNLARALSGYSESRMKANLTITNSKWTSSILRRIYGIEAEVVYPPVHLEGETIPWDKRENGFLCIGRVEPQKRILKVIEILKAVRAQGFPIHLHIIGPKSNSAYVRQIQKEISTQSWITLDGPVSRSKLSSLIASHKFGIHGMPYEHFGIAVAEMVKAGCIVFVPNGGGQVEIVDNDERFIYKNEEDAVAKITSILTQPQEVQAKLSQEMKLKGERFSSERFVSEIRKIINRFVN